MQDFGIVYTFASECAHVLKWYSAQLSYTSGAIQALLDALLNLTMDQIGFDVGVRVMKRAERVTQDFAVARLESVGSRFSGWKRSNVRDWRKIFFFDVSNEGAFCQYVSVFQDML